MIILPTYLNISKTMFSRENVELAISIFKRIKVYMPVMIKIVITKPIKTEKNGNCCSVFFWKSSAWFVRQMPEPES